MLDQNRITIGTDVPNTSIKHDKIDKEQTNRATAINTDITLNGEKVSAEDLRMNTDLSKAQEVTKDEEKHLDAELHTDLIGEDKRNEIKYAFKKLGSLHEILDQKKFKESMEGVLLDKFKDEHQKEFNLIKDKDISLEDKQRLAQNLVERYLRENGYQGVIPEVLLTDEAHSFTVDSKNKATGAKRGEKIYFSINDIANPDLAFSQLFGHEKAHMNTYDEGKDGEETSIHTREKIGSENKNKVFTEEEKADYLSNLRDKYKNQKSIEEQFAEAKLIPEKDKEHYDTIVVDKEVTFKVGGVRGGSGIIYDKNSETGEEKYGVVFFLEPEIGPNIASGGVGVRTYSKPGAPIKDFQGFFGTVKGIVGFGIRGSAEMEINGVNNVNYRVDVTLGSGTIGCLTGIGYRKVWKINPPEALKKDIRWIIRKKETIEDSYETLEKLKNIIDYAETLK